jgi:hypothetical protein
MTDTGSVISTSRLIIGFEYEADAQRFLGLLRERMGKFALALLPLEDPVD